MRKKVDDRIRTLMDNGVKLRHRSMFVIIGDKSRDQIVNLHYLLSKAVVKARPSVLWCYKEKLELSSHKQKRAKQVKRLLQRGLLDPEKVDPFSLFVESGRITYCLYKDSDRVLGNTFGMCILQDFEALEPNLLARTIEAVEGGGIIVLLLRSLYSLTSLHTMVMDVHKRFRKESHPEAAGRFNERFLLSLVSCKACVVMDDELNILPISSHMKSITPVHLKEASEGLSEAERDLKNLKEELNEDFPVGPLIKKCCTLDQGRSVMTFFDAILDRTLRSTVALLAGRGRGKSAALGLAVAGAVAAGYSNIFITAPSPENLKTLFEFVCKGLDSLDYKEHIDYDVVKSFDSHSKKVTVRINIYKQHRQTIQYVQPHEHEKLSQVELLVVDEAAAIPLPVVKSLLGPYLIFMSSTVNGYEGTGRSISLKLLQQLEQQSQISKNLDGGRIFKKIELSESIRYASGDPIESWLNGLLCLDAANSIPKISRLPSPGECDLYYVNRDTLFSYHRHSELFLQRMMALFVVSHYKNSPNDLQLMADAPAHHLFVLLGPVVSKNHLPDILCAIQVCLEGQISHESAIRNLRKGDSPDRDQIPWKFCEQFRDTVFPSLSGVRIVRIATHPSVMGKGYGSMAVQLLTRYFEGQLTSISETDNGDDIEEPTVGVAEAAEKVSLQEKNLLVHLSERRPEKLHYIGVSFGLTQDLLRFWRKHKFAPFYICQIPNPVTGEHTCMVLKPLRNDDIEVDRSNECGFVAPFFRDFKQRFTRLLGGSFRSMEFKLAMSVLDPRINFTELEPSKSSFEEFLKSINEYISPYDMMRLQDFTNRLVDYHVILDLVPVLSHLYFQERIPVTLSYTEASVLLCFGLQNQNLSYIKGQMKELDCNHITSSLREVLKKFYKYLYVIASKEIESTLPRLKQIEMEPHIISLENDLDDAAKQVKGEMKAKAEGLLDRELLQQYVVEGEFEEALRNRSANLPLSGLISVKSSKCETDKAGKVGTSSSSSQKEKTRKKDDDGNKSNKKRKS